jgi:hypothetical protein
MLINAWLRCSDSLPFSPGRPRRVQSLRPADGPDDRHRPRGCPQPHDGTNRQSIIPKFHRVEQDHEGKSIGRERADHPRERESAQFNHVASRDDLARFSGNNLWLPGEPVFGATTRRASTAVGNSDSQSVPASGIQHGCEPRLGTTAGRR